jgi:hypothetical protein
LSTFRAPSQTRGVACALAVVLSACAPSYRVQVYQPGFTGLRSTVLEGNVLSSGSLFGAADVELNVERVDSLGNAAPRFALLLRVRTDGPGIHPSQPLTLLLDADSIRVPRDTLARSVARSDGVRVEEARYPVAAPELRRLSAATDARLRVRVGPWTEERRIHPHNLENLRRFLQEHLPPDSATNVTPAPPAP